MATNWADVWKGAADAALGQLKDGGADAVAVLKAAVEDSKDELASLLQARAQNEIDQVTFDHGLDGIRGEFETAALRADVIAKVTVQKAGDAFFGFLQGALVAGIKWV